MKILFVQLPVPTLVPQQNIGNHLLASSSLYLHLKYTASFAVQIAALSQTICSRGGDCMIIDSICSESPDIVAFTCTVWNIERTVYISQIIKTRLPLIRIWYGGPEIAADSYILQEKYSCFDLAVEGEGEEIFKLLISGADPCHLKRVHVPDGLTFSNKTSVPLLKTLHSIHDPFTNGFALMEKDRVIVTELFRGCKYGCLFCKYHDGKHHQTCSMRPYDQVAALFDWARNHDAREFFLLDPSFEQRPDIDTFLTFLSSINRNPVIPVFAELRAEYVDPLFAKKLYDAGVLHVETGLQTLSTDALRKVGRTLDANKFVHGIRNLQKTGIKIRTDIMLGLPGDSPDGLQNTAGFLNKLDIGTSAQVFKTQVLPGTKLRQAAHRFGIMYEDRPPYQVISTPQWSESDLNESLYEVESLLGINCAPDERPHIIIGNKKEYVLRKKYQDASVSYALYFDATTTCGREYIRDEKFTDFGFAGSVIVKLNDLVHTGLISAMLLRMVQSNPFSTMITGMYIPPLFPLNIFDIIEAALLQCSYSDYVPKLFPTAYSKRPHRRILACLDFHAAEKYTKSWLEALRIISEIIWIIDKDGYEKIVSSADLPWVESEDYLYLDLPFLDAFFSEKQILHLSCSRYTHQLIFSDIGFQWDFLERSQKQ